MVPVGIWVWALDHGLMSSQADACGCELGEGEGVCGVLLIAGCDGSEVLELVEEALDEVSVAIQEGAEGWNVHTSRHGPDVGPSAPSRHPVAQGIAVVGSVGDQGLTGSERVQPGSGAAPVMGLSVLANSDDP